MKTINIKFDDRSYPIYIGQGLISDYELISQHLPHKKIVIITNDLVADIYLDSLKNSLSPGYIAQANIKSCQTKIPFSSHRS